MTKPTQADGDLRDGRITSIRAQKKSPDRVSIFINEAYAFGMHRDLLLEFDLAKGVELSVKRQAEIIARDAFFRARGTAFRYLSYRDRSAEEIRRRLRRDEFAETVIDDTIHFLESNGYVDDFKFAHNVAEGRFRTKGYGPMRVRADLRRMGVRTVAIDDAIGKVYQQRDEVLDRAREIGAKRWNRLSGETDPLKRKKKVYDYLGRRGFSFEMIRRVVDELAES